MTEVNLNLVRRRNNQSTKLSNINLNIGTGLQGPAGVVSATPPIVYDSEARNISITQADATTDGYLSSVDWNRFNDSAGIKKFSATWLTEESILINHNLNSEDVTYTIRDGSSGEVIGCMVTIVVEDNVISTASEGPPVGGWKIAIIG